MISEFFETVKIKHADWPHILGFFLPAVIISLLIIWLSSALTGLIVLVILSLLSLLIYQTHLYRSVRRDIRDQQQKNQAYQMLMQLLDIKRPLPYMTDWAATPELSLAILDIIMRRKPVSVLELGGGISTIISSMSLLRAGEGNVLALDHDESYTRKSQKLLKKNGLDSVATVVHTPLTSIQTDRGKWIWYDLSAVPFRNEPIDLLIVDGPPVKTQNCARYPALPLLYSKLADDAVIILHDTHRKSESTFINWWKDEYPCLVVDQSDTEKGLAVIYINKRGAEPVI